MEVSLLTTLHWRHNDHDSVSNHQSHDCLLNRLFRRRSKKAPKLRATGLCAGNSPGPVNSPHKGPVTRKMFHLMTSSWIYFPVKQLLKALLYKEFEFGSRRKIWVICAPGGQPTKLLVNVSGNLKCNGQMQYKYNEVKYCEPITMTKIPLYLLPLEYVLKFMIGWHRSLLCQPIYAKYCRVHMIWLHHVTGYLWRHEKRIGHLNAMWIFMWRKTAKCLGSI